MKFCYASPKLKTFTNTSESLLTINIHLLCIFQDHTVYASDWEYMQRSTGTKDICGIKTLEKTASGCGEGLTSQSSQSIWSYMRLRISSKTIVSLHRLPNSKQNVLARSKQWDTEETVLTSLIQYQLAMYLQWDPPFPTTVKIQGPGFSALKENLPWWGKL